MGWLDKRPIDRIIRAWALAMDNTAAIFWSLEANAEIWLFQLVQFAAISVQLLIVFLTHL